MIPICASRPGSGRPSSYKPEHTVSLRLYFENAAKRIDELITAGQRENLPFPTIAAWTRQEKLERRAPDRWAARNPDFKKELDFAKQLQRDLGQLAREYKFKFSLVEAEE
jgi:hypothetical protein